MGQPETFSFDKGINRRKKNRLFLADDELYSCEGLIFDSNGVLKCRPAKSVVDTITNSIHSIHRYSEYIMAGNARDLSVRDPNGTYGSIGTLSNSERLRFEDYEDFIFLINRTDKKVYDGTSLMEWGADNPGNAPTVVAGGGTGLTGTYSCYITFLITFNNGKTYETGPSTAGSVSPSNEDIDWSNIPLSSYSGASSIHRKLYRTVSGTAYLVTTITDNTTTVYIDDDLSDAALQLKSAISTTSYSTPPSSPVDVELHLQKDVLDSG